MNTIKVLLNGLAPLLATIGLLFGSIYFVASPAWNVGAFVVVAIFVLLLVASYREQRGSAEKMNDYFDKAYLVLSISICLAGAIHTLIGKIIGTEGYITMLISLTPVLLATLRLNRAIDVIEASMNNIEGLKSLRMVMALPLFYLLLGLECWSIDAAIYTYIPLVSVLGWTLFQRHSDMRAFQRANPDVKFNPKATIARPSSTSVAIVVGAAICVAAHFLFALLPENFALDPTEWFDTSLVKVAIPMCILGGVIVWRYPYWEHKILALDVPKESYVAESGRLFIYSMLCGVVAAIAGFEAPKAGAVLIFLMPALMTYYAYIYTYNSVRRLPYMLFLFGVNLLAGFIGIAAVWFMLFLVAMFFLLSIMTGMTLNVLSNPFGNGVVADGSRINVWDADAGRSIHLRRLPDGSLEDLQGNPWEEAGTQGQFRPRGSNGNMSGQTF